MRRSVITIDVPEHDDGPVDVTHRGGVLQFATQLDALAFVARRLADRPTGYTVEVRVRS